MPLAVGSSVSLSFASCILPVRGQGGLTTPRLVAERRPTAFALLGDAIYIDEPHDACFSTQCYRQKYQVLVRDRCCVHLWQDDVSSRA